MFPPPIEGSVFFENELVYACLAFHPIIEGHTIVFWKPGADDLNNMSIKDYHYFMRFILRTRGVLLDIYNTDKVYVIYLDEDHNVHFQLFPRAKNSKLLGYELLAQTHGYLTDFSKIPLLTKAMR